MIQNQLSFEEFREMLGVRLREVREADPGIQDLLVRRAWAMMRSGVPWSVVVACTRSGCPLAFEMLESPPEIVSSDVPAPDETPPPDVPTLHTPSEWSRADTESADPLDLSPSKPREDGDSPGAASNPLPASYEVGRVDPQDLAREAPLPLRREVGRYERERLSSATRQAIRMAHHAKRWHEIRKMRNVLMGIDQAHLKRMLGDESEALSQEINALLRSWAPLVRDRQGRPMRRRR